MHTLILLVPFISFSVLVVIFLLFAANVHKSNPTMVVTLVLVSIIAILVMAGTYQSNVDSTEQDLVVTESGKVTKVIKNVHSVTYTGRGSIIMFTYRNGRVGQIIEGPNRRVTIKKAHEYKEYNSMPKESNFKNIGNAYQYKPISEYNNK